MDTANTTTTDFAAALRVIQDAARASTPAKDRIHVLPVAEPGHENEIDVPLVVGVGSDGRPFVTSLFDTIKTTIDFLRAERLRNADGPDFISGTASMQSLASFIAHVQRFKYNGWTVVWADGAQRRLVAVFDYHEGEGGGSDMNAPHWTRHRSIYPCPLSEAWMAWGGGEEKRLEQDALSTLLDTRDRELVGGTLPSGKPAPDPAALVTMAASLETFSSEKVKRERDKDTRRVKLAFSSDTGFLGDVMPPPSFLVKIPVFQDAEPQELEMRLRAEVKDGKAAFSLRIHAAGDVLRAAFASLCKQVGRETGLLVFQGTPEQ